MRMMAKQKLLRNSRVELYLLALMISEAKLQLHL
jgi:hypothetical protein